MIIYESQTLKFYHEFMVSETGHYTLFLDLAKTYIDPEYVKKRWEEFLNYEAELIQNIEYRGDRVH